jgi:hypothetical protein
MVGKWRSVREAGFAIQRYNPDGSVEQNTLYEATRPAVPCRLRDRSRLAMMCALPSKEAQEKDTQRLGSKREPKSAGFCAYLKDRTRCNYRTSLHRRTFVLRHANAKLLPRLPFRSLHSALSPNEVAGLN